MTDAKLDELIDDVVFKVGNYTKGKQAILDYVEELVPEKIYLTDLAEFNRTDKPVLSFFSKEYILKDIADADYNEALREGHNDGYQDACKDATKPIREVWEKYPDNEEFNNMMIAGVGNPKIDYLCEIINDHRQAIKATGINAGWIKDEK